MVVDADERVRESLTGLLCIGERLAVVGSAGQTTDALDLAADQHPDIVIIDPRLPENDGGVVFIERLRETVPGVRIIGMSRNDGEVDAGARRVLRWVRPQDLPAERPPVGHPWHGWGDRELGKPGLC